MKGKMTGKSKTKHAILGVLSFGPHSGYDIAKFCREVISSFWGESYGQIYPNLKQLATDGLVRVHAESKGDRRKKIYELTAAGRKELKRWLSEPAKPQPVRNEVLLKLFFAFDVSAEISREHIRYVLESNQQLVKWLMQARTGLQSTDFTKAQNRQAEMSIRLGELIAKARVKWAKECLTDLEGRR